MHMQFHDNEAPSKYIGAWREFPAPALDLGAMQPLEVGGVLAGMAWHDERRTPKQHQVVSRHTLEVGVALPTGMAPCPHSWCAACA